MPLTTHHLRLGSGLVLMSYISLHLFNHMLGIVSLSLAEAGLRLAIRLWQSLPGTVLLYGAFALHFALALHTIHQRRHWQLPAREWLRLWSGFSLPLLLIGHAVNTRVATSFYGFHPSYEKIIAGLISGGSQGWQIALLAPGWVHGCMGLWITVRRHVESRRIRLALAAVFVAVPLLSAAGLVTHKPVTEDYVPLAPWAGVALIGIALGHVLSRESFRMVAPLAAAPRLLRWLGRHSLAVYMVHQPILLGAMWVVLRGGR